MGDRHHLPLVGHDMPYYYVDFPEGRSVGRPWVFAKRLATGQLYWYWRRELASGWGIVGPFATCADAHKDIERSQGYAVVGS